MPKIKRKVSWEANDEKNNITDRNIFLSSLIYPTFFSSSFNQAWIFSERLRKIPQYQIKWRSVQWEPRWYMRTDEQKDGRTDKMMEDNMSTTLEKLEPVWRHSCLSFSNTLSEIKPFVSDFHYLLCISSLNTSGNISFALCRSVTVVLHLGAQINFYPHFAYFVPYFCDFPWRYPCIAVLIIMNIAKIVLKAINM